MPKGKKQTSRVMPIYPRVSQSSSSWLNKAVRATKKSQSELLDTVLSNLSKQFKTSKKIKVLFSDTYATKA